MTRLIWAAVVAIFLLSPGALAQGRKALLVGIDNYESLDDLRKARADARAYAAMLESHGFDVTLVEDVGKSEFDMALAQFIGTIEEGDEVFFAFSGHGWNDGVENYLVPSDVPVRASEDVLRFTTIRLQDTIVYEIARKKPRIAIMVIDACRENPFERNTRNAFARGLVPMKFQIDGTMMIFAARSGELALDRLAEDDPNPNSVFTREFLPRLAAGNVPLQDIAQETRYAVEELARTVDHDQRPSVYDELSGPYCLGGDCRKEEDPAAQICAELAVDGSCRQIEAFRVLASDHRCLPDLDVRFEALACEASWVPPPPSAPLPFYEMPEGATPSLLLPAADLAPEQPTVSTVLLAEWRPGVWRLVCSGVPITPEWIVTNASCVEDMRQGPRGWGFEFLDDGMQAARIAVNGGDVSAISDADFREIVDVQIHPEYNQQEDYETGKQSNDIALIRVSEPVPTVDAPIAVSVFGFDYAFRNVGLSGWSLGFENYDEFRTRGMQRVSIGGNASILAPRMTPSATVQQTVKQSDCTVALNAVNALDKKDEYVSVDTGQFCTVYESRDICLGDGGMALMATDAEGRNLLVGIPAWGIGCGRVASMGKVPSVQMELGIYVRWMEEHTGPLKTVDVFSGQAVYLADH